MEGNEQINVLLKEYFSQTRDQIDNMNNIQFFNITMEELLNNNINVTSLSFKPIRTIYRVN